MWPRQLWLSHDPHYKIVSLEVFDWYLFDKYVYRWNKPRFVACFMYLRNVFTIIHPRLGFELKTYFLSWVLHYVEVCSWIWLCPWLKFLNACLVKHDRGIFFVVALSQISLLRYIYRYLAPVEPLLILHLLILSSLQAD